MNNTDYNSNYNSNDINYNELDNNASNITTNQNHLDKTRPTFNKEMNNFMSELDKKILSKCQSESFWYSSLPLMLGITGFMKYNSLKNLKPLSGLKVFGIAGFSFIFGKLIYLPICQKRLVQSDSNSELVQRLRAKKFKDSSNYKKDFNIEKDNIDQYKDSGDKYSDFDNESKDSFKNDPYAKKF